MSPLAVPVLETSQPRIESLTVVPVGRKFHGPQHQSSYGVEAGEDVVIARDNRPVARLAPLAEQARARAIVEETLAARDANPNRRASREEILAWRHEGHSR